MSRLRALVVILSGVLLLLAVAAWLARFRVAEAVIGRRLAAAGVPASYRITGIGPLTERIEDVRIGDPAMPDLLARSVTVHLAYGMSGPKVRAVAAEGVRLRGRLDGGGLSLGALDRLLPRSGKGGAALPDLDLRFEDARLTLATPNGALNAWLEGAGNPWRRFDGQAQVAATALRFASCRLAGVRAELALTAVAGAPRAAGPLWIARTACPHVAFGAGRAGLALTADPTLRRVAANATLDGFGGTAGPARFASLTGTTRAAGRIGALDINARVGLTALALPGAARQVGHAGLGLAGTPFAATAARAQQAVAAMLAGADADLSLAVAVRGREVAVRLRQATLRGSSGATIRMAEGSGVGWSGQGLRIDAAITGDGGNLPPFAFRLRQDGAGYRGTARVGAYRVGAAALEVPRLAFAWDGAKATVDSLVRADGPFAAGAVRGLRLPLRGTIGAGGAFVIGEGCRPVAFDVLRLGSFTFDAGQISLCGSPLLARAAGGRVRIDAALGAFALSGRASGGAPITLAAASAHATGVAATVRDLAMTFGAGPSPTRITVAALDGGFAPGAIAGGFTGATARIGTVPLALSEAAGQWRFGDGVLGLDGALHVADTAATPRFRTLDAAKVTFTLAGNAIRADAILREPASGADVAHVDLTHDLGTGAGQARLAIDGLVFRPKGLQPDALTPLTVGVIANVDGRVDGEGRIAWDTGGVTSTGSFATERLDLAAAFGPVAGIKGRIDFTDLLNLVSAPDQVATVATINPGVAIMDGIVRYSLPGQNRVAVAGAEWPFAGGVLRLDPTTLDLGTEDARHLTFRISGLDAAAFVQQLDFPNLAATGTFDGVLPLVFVTSGGRVVGGSIVARSPGGTLAYVGELSSARIGMMGKLAFDALKAIRYSTLRIDLDGQLDGEMVSRVGFTGVREATPDRSIAARMIRNLPFRFNINIRAPFRGLVGTARSYMEPQLLLDRSDLSDAAIIQPPATGGVR